MPTTHRFVANASAERLDRFLASRLPQLTRSHIKQLIDDGLATIAGRPAKPSAPVRSGERVELTVPDVAPLEAQPEAIALNIVYEDDDLLVIDKPAGMTVHPAPGHDRHTLVNAVLAHCPSLAGIKGTARPGIVHRLDKDTSGLIVVAKNDVAHQSLQRQFAQRSVEKRYVALAKGRVEPREGFVDAPLARDPRNRKRIAVVAKGRPSQTAYRVLEYLDGSTLVEAMPKTGRTHQIRAHFAHLRHPLIGDTLYGGKSPLLDRQFLHAAGLAFTHPRTSALLRFTSPLPPDLQRVLTQMRSLPL
ncbi:MAG: RluA family pseudouridine synthase [Chloroflexi bacterium]|nr:RluA family pseudouridine synthase [Chloroflexota bacterium]